MTVNANIDSFIKSIKHYLRNTKNSLLRGILPILINNIDEDDTYGIFCETVLNIKKTAIDIKQFRYALELLVSINDSSFDAYDCLFVARAYDSQENSFAVIEELISIFENIIDVNNSGKLDNSNVNRVVAQLANLNSLSRSLDAKCISNIKYQFKRLKDEYLNDEFISSPGFSQEGEDLILKRLFPHKKEGVFVDVGAHHPTRFSNTYLLYLQGWRGINIDPLPGTIDLFNSMRPRDINVEAAVGFPKGDQAHVNYVTFEEAAYNTIIYGKIEDHDNFGKSKILDTIRVPLRKLDDILSDHASFLEKIDFCSIDVEGNELAVLEGFSIEKYQPTIIVVENKGFSIDTMHESPVYKHLHDSGYKIRSVLFNSLIFERATK